MSNPLRVGIIGCGAIAQIMHIPNIIDTPTFELVALSDVYQPILDAVADRYNITHRFTDWHDLLALEALDAVIICHSGSHRDSVIASLEAGKHVLCEKPLAWNLREIQEVQQVAKNSDRVLMLGYHKLYDPAFAYTKTQLAEINDLAYVESKTLVSADEINKAPYAILLGDNKLRHFDYDLPDFDAYREANLSGLAGGDLAPLTDEALGARKDDQALRLIYGLLTISMIHQIYTLHGFLGAPTEVIHAELWREGMSLHVMLAYPNDVRCALNWQYLPYLNNYHEEYAFYGNHRRVWMTLPSPYYRNFPSPVIVQGGDGELSWEKRITVSYREAFHNELLAFAENIHTGKKPLSSVDDALLHAQFIQQVIEAIK